MKFILSVILVVILLAGGLTVLVLQNGPAMAPNEPAATQATDSQTITTGDFSANDRTACQVLTIADAKKLLGESAAKVSASSETPISTAEMHLTNCSYSLTSNTDTIEAILLVRAAKTKSGFDSNQNQFTGGSLPDGAVVVTGYGDSAFWNPQFGQLNILKNGNWYILSMGTIRIGERRPEDAKKMADMIIYKL